MSKHTPEPWAIHDIGGRDFLLGDLPKGPEARVVAEVPRRRTIIEGLVGTEWVEQMLATDRANFDRIVACVNACAGISTEALEFGAIANLVKAAQEVAAYLVKLHRGEPLPYPVDGAANMLSVALYYFRTDANPAVIARFMHLANHDRPVIDPTPTREAPQP